MSILERINPPEDVTEIVDVAGKIRKIRFSEQKLFKASNTSKAAIMISPEIIDISAPESNDTVNTVGVSVIGNSGTVIRGPLGLTAVPENIRIAGMWKFNNLLLSAAPSTILTPIPVLRFSLPLSNIAELIKTTASIGVLAGIL